MHTDTIETSADTRVFTIDHSDPELAAAVSEIDAYLDSTT